MEEEELKVYMYFVSYFTSNGHNHFYFGNAYIQTNGIANTIDKVEKIRSSVVSLGVEEPIIISFQLLSGSND